MKAIVMEYSPGQHMIVDDETGEVIAGPYDDNDAKHSRARSETVCEALRNPTRAYLMLVVSGVAFTRSFDTVTQANYTWGKLIGALEVNEDGELPENVSVERIDAGTILGPPWSLVGRDPWANLGLIHDWLCHPDGEPCPDGCDYGPDPYRLAQYRNREEELYPRLPYTPWSTEET